MSPQFTSFTAGRQTQTYLHTSKPLRTFQPDRLGTNFPFASDSFYQLSMCSVVCRTSYYFVKNRNLRCRGVKSIRKTSHSMHLRIASRPKSLCKYFSFAKNAHRFPRIGGPFSAQQTSNRLVSCEIVLGGTHAFSARHTAEIAPISWSKRKKKSCFFSGSCASPQTSVLAIGACWYFVVV